MMIKWLSGLVGWQIGGPIGAVLGYLVGSLLDNAAEGGAPGRPFYEGVGDNSQQPQSNADSVTGNRFLFIVVVLASAVIKADGRIMHSEMEYVRRFFRQNFPNIATEEVDTVLKQLFNQQIDLRGCAQEAATLLNPSSCLSLLDFLVGIARADWHISKEELDLLRQIAADLRLNPKELDSLMGLGENTLEEAYRVLEVSPTASDYELRKAYKKLVLKHHPDRVASLGENVRRRAEEKLQQINAAYDAVCKSRGI